MPVTPNDEALRVCIELDSGISEDDAISALRRALEMVESGGLPETFVRMQRKHALLLEQVQYEIAQFQTLLDALPPDIAARLFAWEYSKRKSETSH